MSAKRWDLDHKPTRDALQRILDREDTQDLILVKAKKPEDSPMVGVRRQLTGRCSWFPGPTPWHAANQAEQATAPKPLVVEE